MITAQGQIRLLAASESEILALISAFEAAMPGVRFTAPRAGRNADWLAYGTVVVTAGAIDGR